MGDRPLTPLIPLTFRPLSDDAPGLSSESYAKMSQSQRGNSLGPCRW